MATAPDPDEVLRSTRGKENFQRISRLLISGGTTLLREIFDLILPLSNLPTVLKNPATEKQLRSAKLTKPQWDCLYPSPGVYGKSTDFDVTLLFKLLRTICKLIPPATGWDAMPTGTDHSLAADLARIKYYRNSVFGHVNQNMEITDDQFLVLWQDISEVLVRIAGQISPTKKPQWQVAIFNFLRNPFTAEDERNVQELLEWYRNDMEATQTAGALVQLRIDCETNSGPGLQGFPTAQEVLNLAASKYLMTIDPLKPEDLNGFVYYLEKVRKTLIVDTQSGSLVITVECNSLEILDELWYDYCNGFLNKMVQKFLVDDEVLKELGITEVKLTTTILEEDYRACREYLLQHSVGTLKTLQPTEASQSVAEGKGIEEGTVGVEAQFVLTTRNAEGRHCYDKDDRVTVEIRDEQGRECVTKVRINDNKDGSYKISYSPNDQGKYKVTVKVNGKHVLDSPFSIEVKLFQLRPVFSFGKLGSSVGMFNTPWGVAVNARDEIAVTDSWNDRVQIFNSDGKYLRSFGQKGNKAGEFANPKGITFHKNGNIFVADKSNHRIQIFSGEGKYVGMFGGKGSLDSQLKEPWGLSVDSDGNIIVADAGNQLIKIFSPDGKFLMKIGGQGSFTFPIHCVQCDRYLIVSDNGAHRIKVFNYDGNFQYEFGEEGRRDGEFSYPNCLSVNKSGHLMACDKGNNRIQVFQLNGKFVGKFGTGGSNLGEFNYPSSVAVLSNGRIAVCEVHRRIQILE